jgi:hypothetical protein
MLTLSKVLTKEKELIERGRFLSRNKNEEYQKELKKVKRDIAKLKPFKLHLETNPSEELINKQLQKYVDIEKSIMVRFEEWMKNTPNSSRMKNPQKEFLKETSMKEVRAYIKCLNKIKHGDI